MHIKFLFVFHSPLIQSRDNWISPSLILTPWGRNLIIADFYLVHALMVSTSAVRTPSKIFSKQFFKRQGFRGSLILQFYIEAISINSAGVYAYTDALATTTKIKEFARYSIAEKKSYCYRKY